MNIYKNKTKLTASIVLNGILLEALSPSLRKRQGHPTLPFLFNTVLEFLVNTIRQEKFKKF